MRIQYNATVIKLLSEFPAARAIRWGLLAAAMLFGLLSLKGPLECLTPPSVYQKDFLQDYIAARALADQTNPYRPVAELATRYLGSLPVTLLQHPTPHPPLIAVLCLPLAAFDYLTAARIWFVLEMIFLLAAFHFIGSAMGFRAFASVGIICLVWYPFRLELASGQWMILVLLLLAGVWLAWRCQRSLVAGVLLGLALAIKPIVWPVILWFVLQRDRRAVLAALLTGLGGYLVPLALIGGDSWFSYWTEVLPSVHRAYRSHVWNGSVAALGWRLFDGTGSPALFGISSPPLLSSTRLAWATAVLLPVGMLVWLTWLASKQPRSESAFGVFICVSLLVGPITWEHYHVLTVIPLVQLIALLRQRCLPRQRTAIALLVAVLLLLSSRDWAAIAFYLTGTTPSPAVESVLPSRLTLLTMMPTVALALLAWLLTALHEGVTYVTASCKWLFGERKLAKSVAEGHNRSE